MPIFKKTTTDQDITKMDPVHFYCVQVFTTRGNIHLHAMEPTLLDKSECFKIAQEIMTTGKLESGDHPHFCFGAVFKVDELIAVHVEHKATMTRAELDAKDNGKKDEDTSNPFTSILRSMQ